MLAFQVNPLKILHVTPSFYPAVVYGGPTYSVYGLCRSLIHQGCLLRVLTTDANGPRAVLEVDTRTEIEISPGLFVRYCHRVMDVSVSPTLLRLLHANICWADVVHLTAVYSFPTIPTLLTCRIVGKPVVWSPRGMLQRWQGTSRTELKAIWEKACRLAAPERLILHATSEEEACESEARLPGVKTVVVPNGVEFPDAVHRGGRAGWFRLAYLGRLHPKKNIESLLYAYHKIYRNLGIATSLVIAGAGEQPYIERIKAQIQELGLSERVKMIGQVADDDKRRVFENSDLTIVPSHTENFAMVVAESLAHGVPVIASRGTPWRSVEEVGCGLWVDNDPESLSAAMKRCVALPLREMGLKGREWMQRDFAWNSVAAKMSQVYRNALATRGS